MLIAIDIGNTNCRLALYERGKPVTIFGFHSSLINQEGSFRSLMAERFQKDEIKEYLIQSAIISSVVPSLSAFVGADIRALYSIPCVFVDATMDSGITFRYDNLKSLGPDRVCCSAAAYSKFGGPVIAVDAGTAITFDCINDTGEFVGGAIMPGYKTAAEGLSEKTARLPKVDLVFPESCCATSTVQAVQSGIMYGLTDAVDGMIVRMKNILGSRTKTVITGGAAEMVLRKSKTSMIHEPLLIFEGLHLLARRQNLIPG